jgi:RNA polymerase sigma factor (sigma-70 family)
MTESLAEHDNQAADAPLLQQEQKETLEQAIGRLTPSEQRLIRMKSEELSLEEIAEQTGVSKHTASTMLWQAKKRLLTILKITNHD